MKIRWPVAAITLVVTLSVLFGGYMAYQWFQVEKPITETVQETPHVSLSKLSADPAHLELVLKTDEKFSVVHDYMPLRRQLHTVAGDRKLSIRLKDRPDSHLHKAWNEMVFGIKEGMALRRYQEIPKAVQKGTEGKKIEYEVSMDDSYVYIELHRGDRYLYRILPLHKPESEVKDNG
ncbi:hypothetical protein [Paludifilum halophilum]|uniref:Uncharacterized protein n=1 Tax=Paludifilum halophilum TaxID=1642702 RepID=A0A235BBJ7_9BACL|nr:hypothetical protein [Paludifilum halophilum]OYD09663.1 hypothetical protein CHM34_01265 [Paludifilum halophilum]